MITLKNADQAAKMRRAGHLLEDIMLDLMEAVKPGITTMALSQRAEAMIRKAGAIPSFLGYQGFPAALCTSIDDAVVHGIPDERPLKEGQIIGLDLGLILDGWQSDMARTVGVGAISKEARRLIEASETCFMRALDQCYADKRLGDIGHAVEAHAESQGFSVVRDLCGHGIGRDMHEGPEVNNFGQPGHGLRLRPGMTIAIEPMINEGGCHVTIDGWDVRTQDGSLSAHYENTVLITSGPPEVLTIKAVKPRG